MAESERHPTPDGREDQGKQDKKRKESHVSLDIVLAEICRRGFFGKAHVEITVQDGVIQGIRNEVTRVRITD